MRKVYLILFLSLSVLGNIQAQKPSKLDASEIYQEIKKLNFLGSVLYVAAHPDDENTRLISYLSNGVHARTAYLSLTRGDGGQNLIGSQLRELLGVIRTQELLAARKTDGGLQFFTRANDFGYSKNPEETLEIWQEEEVLKDVVRVIRMFKPDIIINRFSAESAGTTHGHHTSSAILSSKAFGLAGKSTIFPEQAEQLGVWNPKKLFFNTSPWFYPSQEAFEAADKSALLELETGIYYPELGLSNTEIASLSRSQHRSQGFGSTGTRGKTPEYIELISGSHPEGTDQIFAGINTSWSRIDGGKEIGEILERVEKEYNFRNPAASLPGLVRAYELIENLSDTHWKNIKTAHIKQIIAACAGLYLEAIAEQPIATPGEEINIELEAINRSTGKIFMNSIHVSPSGEKIDTLFALKNNETWKENILYTIPDKASYTTPYWLLEKGDLGLYKVKDDNLIGLPETPVPYEVEFYLTVEGVKIRYTRKLVFKRNDPVQGETYRPFEIVPPLSVSTRDKVITFANHAPKEVPVTLKAMQDSVSGEIRFKKMDSWQVEPTSYAFGPLLKGEEVTFSFSVKAPEEQEVRTFIPEAVLNGKSYSKEVVQIDYPHIPLQTMVLPSETKLVKLNIKKDGSRIGYIEGAGDAVPKALEQIGYSVEIIAPNLISSEDLKEYDAVVLGIRSFNVLPELQYKKEELFEYVASGGNLIVQYNTSRGLVTEELAPYPLQLSRNRVTDEKAQVEFLDPDHPALNFPNKITQEDFNGWVQERGLYFPDEWGAEFQPLLSMNDPGETPKKGSLLVAPYGKGFYVYTGLSFFREFPAGVPGAFRLFANLIALKNAAPENPSTAPKKYQK